MKFVEINGTHINTNNVQAFFWKDGMLWIRAAFTAPTEWDDPTMELYRKLCAQLGVRPYVEEKEDGATED